MGTLFILIVIAGAIYFIHDWKKKKDKEKALMAQSKAELEQRYKDTQSIIAQIGEPSQRFFGKPDVMIFDKVRKVSVGTKVFSFDDIVSVEAPGVKYENNEPDKITTETKQGLGSTIGRAAVGAAIGGVVGGVVGAASARKTTTTIQQGKHEEFNDYWVTIKLKGDEVSFQTYNDDLVKALLSLAPSK